MCEKVMCDDGIEREVVSRKEAKEQGLVRYFTGKACKHGHVAERATNIAACIVCQDMKSSERLKEEQEKKIVRDDSGVLRETVSRKEAKESGLDFYFTGKPCKNGHVTLRRTSCKKCLQCTRDRSRESYRQNPQRSREYLKKYREENRDELLKKKRDYYYDNKEQISKRSKEHYQKNKEEIAKKAREYERRNKDKVNDYWRGRYKDDPYYRTSCKARKILRRTLEAAALSKDASTEEMLGYTSSNLKHHIESLFVEGMSWDNYSEWHIDHLTPIKKFIDSGCEDPKVINSLENLAPMWAQHNLEKGESCLEDYLERRPDLISLYGHLLER